MVNRKIISILSLSQNRTVVNTIREHIQPHSFSIGGILESDPFSATELAFVLKVLEPRPQVVLVGRGYTESEMDMVLKVFAQYAKDVNVNSGTIIKITSQVFNEVGKEGVPEWVLQQLQNFFKK